MKKVLYKTHTITFQEKVGVSFQPRSFNTPKEHLEFHLKNLQKMPEVIRGVKVVTKQS